MPEYSLDYETRSRADLRKVGAFRYAYDPSTEILCFSLLKENGEPRIWVPKKWRYIVEGHMPLVPDHELDDLSKPDAVISAFNATFECAITDALFKSTTRYRPICHEQWRCVASMARRAALPGSLKKLGEALNLTEQKDSKGDALIRKFSVPHSTGKRKGEFTEPDEDPEAFRDFCLYCLQDTRTEREAKERLKDFELKGLALDCFQLTLAINTRGFPVNLDALRKAEKLVAEETLKVESEFVKLTGGIRPSQGAKLLVWLKERGFKHDNLKAETLEEFFEEFDDELDETTLLGQVLTLKRRIGFASLKKIPAMIACAGPHDNRVRGTHKDHGAGTGRWTAELVQPQNFKKPAPYMEKCSGQAYKDICDGCTNDWLELVYGPPLEVIASCIRHFIQDDGPMLNADYSSIEARLMAWQTQEKWRLDVFKTHGQIYEASACQMFGMTMQEFTDYKAKYGKHHPMRQKGKFGELSLQYMGSHRAIIKMGGLKQGLKEEELPELVKVWRAASPNFGVMWNQIGESAKNAIRSPGKLFPFGVSGAFFSTQTAGMKFLFMRLPSGRRIAYPQPELVPQISWSEDYVEVVQEKDEETGATVTVERVVKGEYKKIIQPTADQVAKTKQRWPKARMSECITFYGQIPLKKIWGRILLHAGIGANNFIQGIAADNMTVGAINASRAGYKIVALIHDEALSEYDPLAGQSADHFVKCLTKLPAWAEGMPLAAEGGVVEFYLK